MILNNEQIDFFHQNGYILLRDVLTTDEVKKLRAACELIEKGEILGRKEFGYILLDDRIINPLKQLLGEDLVYFGQSYASTLIRSRHMHSDNKSDDYDYSKPYPVARIAFYLQDYENYSGGLKLRPGSHKKPCIEKRGIKHTLRYVKKTGNFFVLYSGKSVNLPIRPRDLIIFNMRVHHSGNAVRVKGLKNHSFHPWIEDRIPAFLHRQAQKKRCVIFATFGTPSTILENFIKHRVHRPQKKPYWIECTKNRFDEPKIRELARSKGVTIRTDGIDNVLQEKK